MKTTTLKTSEESPNARIVRIWRPRAENQPRRRHLVPPAAVYKPTSKWTVVAAVIFAAMLHVGAVVWVGMQQEKPPFDVGAPVLIQPMEEVFETRAGTDVAGADGGKTAVD